MTTPMAVPDAVDHLRRSAQGCLCCGAKELRRETQIVSGFLAARAWGGPPQTTELLTCPACGLRFFERGLSDEETARYYRGYRDADYVRARWRWEPFYTRGQHRALLAWTHSPLRTEAVRAALALSGAPAYYASALDHGGDQGQMLAAVEAERKAVYEPSACATAPGIARYDDAASLPGGWNLILSCQVLEHVSSPAAYLRDITALLDDSGWLYIEVPHEHWRPAPGGETLRAAWLKALLRWRPLLMAADVLCTACRIKLGCLPPFGFVAMREHMNFFTPASLRAILAGNGFAVDSCGINRAGQLFAVARKFATFDAGSDRTVTTIT